MRWLALVGVVAACKAEALPPDVTEAPKIFAAYCAVCHGANGKPPASMVAQLGVRDLTSVELRARVTPQSVEQQVRFGSANKLMPAMQGALTDAQIKSVAAWVASPEFVERP